MDSIVQDLMKQVATGDNLAAISQSVGGDSTAVQSALGMAMPLIMSSMADTASKPGGVDTLMGMVSQLGGANPAENVNGFLGSPQAAGGAGMVSALLGSQMGGIQNAIAQKTGLPPAIVGQILAIAVPVVVGQVGKMFAGSGMDKNALSGLLGDQSAAAMESAPEIAAIAQQVMSGQTPSAGGVMGILKKFLK